MRIKKQDYQNTDINLSGEHSR